MISGLAQRVLSPFVVGYTAYVYDPMGNVTMRMRQVDAATQPYDLSGYDAFGKRMLYQPNVQQTQLNPPDAAGYGGQSGNYTDVEANLVLMTYRFYSPVYCRFLTRDPKGYTGGINLYAYCRNNPINRFDPLGLDKTGLGLLDAAEVQDLYDVFGGALRTNPQLAQQTVASTAFAASATYSYLGGAATLGPIGVAAVAIPALSYGAYNLVGVPLANALFPMDMSSHYDPAAQSLFNRMRNCFVAGTLVAMADGSYKPIEQVVAGDTVLSRDAQTGKTEARKVVQTFVHDVEQTLVLSFANGEQVETTPGHPFFVEGKGFVLAGQLALGNAIVTRAGPATRLVRIQNKTECVHVYNFEVEDFHTYFVGNHNGDLWVHNSSYGDTFYRAHPNLNRPDWVVHHVIPQAVWNKYPGLYAAAEKDALSNLVGIPTAHNRDMHQSNINRLWNGFYRTHPRATTTRQDIEAFARHVDSIWGGNFYPYR